MKQVSAKLNYLKIAPRKVRLVAQSIKNLPAQEAEAQLLMRPQRSASALLKLLRSAIANAKNRELDPRKLYVSSIRVDQGPMLKRFMPRAMGRATSIHKKMSHVMLFLGERETALTQRFHIDIPKKVKKAPKKFVSAKTNTKEEVSKEKREGKKIDEKKPNWFRRVFKRKSI